MSPIGWSVGDFAATSKLAAKVYAAYKDGPSDYRHISEEVMSLQIIIKMAIQHFEHTTLSSNDQQLGQKVLNGCQSILEDLNSLIEKFNSSASANAGQVFKEAKLGAENITTLRVKLISNTGSLNDFFQRFDIFATIPELEYIMLIS